MAVKIAIVTSRQCPRLELLNFISLENVWLRCSYIAECSSKNISFTCTSYINIKNATREEIVRCDVETPKGTCLRPTALHLAVGHLVDSPSDIPCSYVRTSLHPASCLAKLQIGTALRRFRSHCCGLPARIMHLP